MYTRVKGSRGEKTGPRCEVKQRKPRQICANEVAQFMTLITTSCKASHRRLGQRGTWTEFEVRVVSLCAGCLLSEIKQKLVKVA